MTPILSLLLGLMLQLGPTDLPAGVSIWPNGTPPKTYSPDQSGNYVLSVKTRDKDGLAEVHKKTVDIMVIQSGEATLVVGGDVVDPQVIGPGEIHGSAIRNGIKKNVVPGDVIHIQAGVPHQFFIPEGKQITYLLVKVKGQ